MAKQIISVSILLSAAFRIVDAYPRPQSGFPTFSFPGYGYPTQTPTGFSIGPTGFSVGPTGSSGFASPTGTGYSCVVSYVTVPGSAGSSVPLGTGSAVWSVPLGTGSAVSSIPIATSSSASPASSVSASYSVWSAPAAQSSSKPSSLAEAVSASSVPGSSAPASSVAGSSIASVPASSVAGSSVASVPASSAAASSVASVPAASASSVPTSSSSVTASSGCTFTDANAAAASKGSCSTIVLSGITVPAGATLDMTGLNDGTTVSFEGTTTFGYQEWEGPLVSFSGKSITITGASGHVIDGNGAKWWDGQGSNGGKTKPKFFYAHDLTDSTISGLNVKNTPVQGFSVDGAANLKIEDVTIDDSAGDTQGGHNTDCFDIGESTGVYLSGITCKNQDDCIAINSGTDIQFTGGTCSGGHGLSIGSVGGRSDNTVENVYIASSSISNSENGVRIKCNSGDTGTVNNVTYSDITLSGITDYGIVIEQDYQNGSPTGTPTAGIPITDVTLEGITGSVSSGAQAYYILCAACSAWTVSGVDVTGGSQSKSCEGVPSGASSLC